MANLSGVTPPLPVNAVEIVTNQFTTMQEFVDTVYSELEDAVNTLSNYDPGFTTFLTLRQHPRGRSLGISKMSIFQILRTSQFLNSATRSAMNSHVT
jgi:hypothetical protein